MKTKTIAFAAGLLLAASTAHADSPFMELLRQQQAAQQGYPPPPAYPDTYAAPQTYIYPQSRPVTCQTYRDLAGTLHTTCYPY
jgi:hypothetical protein